MDYYITYKHLQFLTQSNPVIHTPSGQIKLSLDQEKKDIQAVKTLLEASRDDSLSDTAALWLRIYTRYSNILCDLFKIEPTWFKRETIVSVLLRTGLTEGLYKDQATSRLDKILSEFCIHPMFIGWDQLLLAMAAFRRDMKLPYYLMPVVSKYAAVINSIKLDKLYSFISFLQVACLQGDDYRFSLSDKDLNEQGFKAWSRFNLAPVEATNFFNHAFGIENIPEAVLCWLIDGKYHDACSCDHFPCERVLGIPLSANISDARDRYRNLISISQPDRISGTLAKARQINKAWEEWLKLKRKFYPNTN